jgi:hypothetical protein
VAAGVRAKRDTTDVTNLLRDGIPPQKILSYSAPNMPASALLDSAGLFQIVGVVGPMQ